MKKPNWSEGVARELSYFTTTEIIKGYQNMYKEYGISFFHTLFHSNQGVLRMIRPLSELHALMNFVEKQPEKYIVKQFEKTYALYKQLKKKLEKGKLNKKSWKEILALSREVWTYNLFCVYFGYAIDRKKIKEISEKYYDLVSKVRNEISNLRILEKFLKEQKMDLSELSGNEISLFLEQHTLPKNLEERKIEYLFLMDDLKVKQIPKEKINKTLGYYLTKEEVKKTDVLKGMTAFPGKFSGRVKIILRKKDLSLLKKGDVLVTLTTTVDYIPFLSKIVGIVTDYGGMISHAAIIAREMKIPCVVGTKVATKTLKDGDHVEVDANKGIVKKVSQ